MCITRLNLKRADCQVYSASRAWRLNPEEMLGSADELLEDMYRRFKKASGVAIAEIIHRKFYPKPDWTNELRVSRSNREKCYQKFRRTKSIQNLINWKRVLAEHRKLLKKTKQESWRALASTFKYP